MKNENLETKSLPPTDASSVYWALNHRNICGSAQLHFYTPVDVFEATKAKQKKNPTDSYNSPKLQSPQDDAQEMTSGVATTTILQSCGVAALSGKSWHYRSSARVVIVWIIAQAKRTPAKLGTAFKASEKKKRKHFSVRTQNKYFCCCGGKDIYIFFPIRWSDGIKFERFSEESNSIKSSDKWKSVGPRARNCISF